MDIEINTGKGIKSPLVGALFLIVGLLFASIGGFVFWDQEQDLANAEKIEGTITSSSVDREVNNDPDGADDVVYYADISYTYEYEGQRYNSSGVFPGPGQTSVPEDRARSLVSKYGEGEQATVYVIPNSPQDTFLVKERRLLLPVMFVGLGLLVALLGGAALYKEYLY